MLLIRMKGWLRSLVAWLIPYVRSLSYVCCAWIGLDWTEFVTFGLSLGPSLFYWVDGWNYR
jgi:hypothetical protein